jgi:uncharacterized Fe-S cluster protein YjdI
MSEREIIKEYKKEDLTIVWKPKTCIHSEECVKRLPKVYRPDNKPWIQPENASIEDLKKQINACPSGALSYIVDREQVENSSVGTKVDIMQNGPLLIHGSLTIVATNGEIETKKQTTAFCRCGASQNKPYCDGKHKQVGFIG